MSNRNRRQPAKQSITLLNQVLKKIKPEHILSIISVFIAGIALFYTWQANKLTQEANGIMLRQISDQLVITKMVHLGSSSSMDEGVSYTPDDIGLGTLPNSPYYLFCSHKVRLSNLGESATSLVNFSVRASYMDEIVFLEGFGEAMTFSKSSEFFSSLTIKDIQSILISEEMLKSNPLDEKWLNNPDNGIDLPISVSGKSALDFIVHTILFVNPSNKSSNKKDIFLIMYPSKTSTADEVTEAEKLNEGIYPLKMTYIFETSSGQIITTNPLLCWIIGVEPSNKP